MGKPLVIGILFAVCTTGLCCRQTIGRRHFLPPSAVPPLCRDEGILAYEYDNAPPSPFAMELEFTIEYLQDLIDSGCSDLLGRFLCVAHYQRLNLISLGGTGYAYFYQKPCADLCRAIWRECRVTARRLGLDRVPELNCKGNYPLKMNADCLSDLFPPNEPPNWITAVTRDSLDKASVHFLSPASTTQAILIRLNETFSPVEREIFHPVDPKGPPERTIEIFHLWNAGSYRIEITALNEFGEGTTTVANIPAYNASVSDDGGTVSDEDYWRCENITVEMCQSGIGYTQTSMPNFLHHWTQEEAAEIHQFSSFVDAQCSPFLRTYLCAMYTPECTDGTSRRVVPCRELCVLARDDCKEDFYLLFGYSWPKYLACENLPSFSEGKECYLGGAPVMTEVLGQCEAITVPMCKSDIGYTKTAMPNRFGHQTQDEVEIEVRQFYPLVEAQCSSFLKTFLCAMYTPQCTSGSRRPMLPCRELCVQVMDRCEGLVQEYGIFGPQDHSCELPSFAEGEDCYLGGAPVTDMQPHDRCQDINVSMCQSGIGYNHTVMPSVLGHETQSEAAIQLSSFMPLVEYGCSPHARSYFCSVYLPMCDISSGAKVLPCRELCDSVRRDCLMVLRKFGFSGPERLVCENLPSRNSGSTCYLGDMNPTISSGSPGQQQFNITTPNISPSTFKPRRYDIHNLGVPSMFHGWVDVQGQGAANDYCRVVTNSTGGYLLSCSLAGMGGSQSDLDYNSTGSWFDAGHVDTWYMMDVNGDRRDDYCRCVGHIPATRVSCLLAGEGGFKTETIDYKPEPGGCHI